MYTNTPKEKIGQVLYISVHTTCAADEIHDSNFRINVSLNRATASSLAAHDDLRGIVGRGLAQQRARVLLPLVRLQERDQLKVAEGARLPVFQLADELPVGVIVERRMQHAEAAVSPHARPELLEGARVRAVDPEEVNGGEVCWQCPLPLVPVAGVQLEHVLKAQLLRRAGEGLGLIIMRAVCVENVDAMERRLVEGFCAIDHLEAACVASLNGRLVHGSAAEVTRPVCPARVPALGRSLGSSILKCLRKKEGGVPRTQLYNSLWPRGTDDRVEQRSHQLRCCVAVVKRCNHAQEVRVEDSARGTGTIRQLRTAQPSRDAR
mmetsp:Transcript_133082/g.265547  ORF Transcript_133082/g.265547 Transcript_133082/m.265547 type:complete len:321 (-) Transcript_133082:156-1118(-)